MIEYKDNYAIIDGIKFRKDKKSGYYLSNNANGKRYRLHRYIWSKYNGDIPKGYEIHHKDQNKDNNNIENLMLVSSQEHKKIHSKSLTKEQREKMRKNMNEVARPKAIEWHKSKDGFNWHKEQYKISLGKMEKEKMICKYCGKEYYSINHNNNKFCSNNCKSAYRRKLGVDDIERKCEKCGETFKTNKYGKRRYCYNCNTNRIRRNRNSRCLQYGS